MNHNRFLHAIDDYVTGRNDPNAPFNRDTGLPLECDDCNVVPCDEPCDKSKNAEEKRYVLRREQGESMYQSWLDDKVEQALKKISEGEFNTVFDKLFDNVKDELFKRGLIVTWTEFGHEFGDLSKKGLKLLKCEEK